METMEDMYVDVLAIADEIVAETVYGSVINSMKQETQHEGPCEPPHSNHDLYCGSSWGTPPIESIDHIQRQTETLLARNEPLLAFQARVDALREYSDYS